MKSQIFLPLKGGLGNQLFQLAFGLHLKKLTSRQIQFGSLGLERWSTRLQTRKFAIHELLNPEEQCGNFAARVTLAWAKSFQNRTSWICEQNINSVIDDLISPKTKCVSGYFQHFRYPDEVWPEIRDRLSKASSEWTAIGREPNNQIVIHVRLGDYFHSASARAFHGLSRPDYFDNAVQFLRANLAQESITVVSDDLGRAADLLSACSFYKKSDVSFQQSENPVTDLAIISNASGVVASNSTFSWWGAFFAERFHGSKVVVPQPWFANQKNEPVCLVPPTWKKLKRELL